MNRILIIALLLLQFNLGFGQSNNVLSKQLSQLEVGIQNRVKSIMDNMLANEHCIFPYKWQEAMANKKLKFDEN